MDWRQQNIRLRRLEAEAIDILREAVSESRNPVMLYSIGKDSGAMLHLAQKAFAPGKPPFPLLHVDTTWKFREMITFRDKIAAKLMTEAGLVVLCSFISPFRAERRMVRELLEQGEFIEIFVHTPIEQCIARDPKGLYRRALAGEIKNFTGVDQPYEAPENADIVLKSALETPEILANRVVKALEQRGLIVAL